MRKLFFGVSDQVQHKPDCAATENGGGQTFSILHILHLHIGGTKCYVFYSGRIRTLVAMATYSFHRLIMGKIRNWQFLLSYWGYLNFFFTEMFIE